MPSAIPLSLYIHIPWCLHKCSYCDFNSHPLPPSLDAMAYVDALLADLRLESPLADQRPLRSLFIGGGTPSLLPVAAVQRLITGVLEQFEATQPFEVTLEANPDAADTERFAGFLQAGVNRISIGIQSFHPLSLQRLERTHTPQAAFAAVEAAKLAGFRRINLDLMYGLPSQSSEDALEDLRQAIALGPEQISRYQLTLEPGTRMESAPPVLPDEETIEAMESLGGEVLERAGFTQYEVSAHAQAGAECQHNLNYWQFGDYLGIGAGAHGKITRDGEIQRRRRLVSPASYQLAAGHESALPTTRTLDRSEVIADFMLNALRLKAGFAPALFAERTGLELQSIEPHLEQAFEAGLLEVGEAWIRPTSQGYRFLNDLLLCFLPQNDRKV